MVKPARQPDSLTVPDEDHDIVVSVPETAKGHRVIWTALPRISDRIEVWTAPLHSLRGVKTLTSNTLKGISPHDMASERAGTKIPFIGISTYVEPSASWRGWQIPASLLPIHYVRMVQAVGGIAVMLPPDRPAAARAAVAVLDGIIISGGPDIAPELYGAARDLRTGPEAVERDAWELALVTAALQLETPLLGICRGMQLINVAFGGTLLQHLDGHGHDSKGMYGSHSVTPVEGTLYQSLVPETTVVPTSHHQAVEILGAGLRASAYASDGTIEAIEAIEGRELQWIMGVQWHPEMGNDQRVLAALLRAAAVTAPRRQLVS